MHSKPAHLHDFHDEQSQLRERQGVRQFPSVLRILQIERHEVLPEMDSLQKQGMRRQRIKKHERLLVSARVCSMRREQHGAVLHVWQARASQNDCTLQSGLAAKAGDKATADDTALVRDFPIAIREACSSRRGKKQVPFNAFGRPGPDVTI
jgi:hypothetical protein